jgi:hypothetical protein
MDLGRQLRVCMLLHRLLLRLVTPAQHVVPASGFSLFPRVARARRKSIRHERPVENKSDDYTTEHCAYSLSYV